MSYKELKTYQNATIIYDFTVEFCAKNIRYYSRTRDQMEQAARSGKQNIVEGSSERVSKKTEIKLLGVSRASFEELLEDYYDFLRQNGFVCWDKNSREAQEARALVYRTDKSYETYRSYLANPAQAANVMVCLINQNNFLLDRQITSVEEKFIREGGWTENIYKRRVEARENARRY